MVSYLFPAEDIAIPARRSLVPRERFSGVPEYYLLHVVNLLEPSADTAGLSLKMDGVDDTVTVAADPSLALARQATVELWFKVDSLAFASGDWMPLVYKGDADTPFVERNYSLWLNKAGYLHFTSANGRPGRHRRSATGSIVAGQWYHVAGVMNRDTGQMTLYINGVQVAGMVGSGNASIGTSADDTLLIGGTYEAGFTPYKGLIDEVRIWNVARNASDILHDYERVVASDAPGLVAYLRFGESSDAQPLPDDGGFTFRDLTANGNDAVLDFGASGTITAPLLDDRLGKPVSTPLGTGQYRIVFSDSLGESVHVSGADASQTLAAVDLAGQPVMISLGDINGDGYGDAVVSVRDLVPDGAGGFRNFARIAFGTADGTFDPQPDWDGDPATVDQPVTLELPAPVLFSGPTSRSVISAAGDIDGDGIGDIAVSVTDGGNSSVYILFGRENWATGNVEQDAGLLGEYFYLNGYPSVTSFPNFNTLTPDLTRVDAQVNFPNTGGSFSGVADSDVFAARWTGQIDIENAGLATFYLASDDGSRMYIDNQLVVDNGGLHAYSEANGTIDLSAGFHDIRIEYFENTGFAGVVAQWDPVGATGKQVIPTSVLFRDSRDVLNVFTDHDVVLSDFSGVVSASAAHDVTPMVGDGLAGSFYDLSAPATEALSFDGNGYVSVDPSDSLALTGSSTVELRFKLDIGSGTYMPLIQKTDGAGFDDVPYSLWINQATGQLDLSRGIERLPGVCEQQRRWLGLAGSRDGDRPRERRGEGVPERQSVFDAIAGRHRGRARDRQAAADRLHTRSRGYGNFVGTIDDVAIWDGARSADEIAADFDGVDDAADGLLAHWRFDEASGDAVLDASTKGNDGTLAGSTPPRRVAGPLLEFPDFATTTPDHTKIDTWSIPYYGVTSDFAGFSDLDDTFAARWSGQIVVDLGGAASGPVSFATYSDGRSRIYIDGDLVVDRNDPTAAGVTQGTIPLDAGIHDITIEYLHDAGSANLALGWDLAGGDSLVGIPGSALLRTDATLDDPTAAGGTDDLLIADGSALRVVHGRAREEWVDMSAGDISPLVAGAWSVAGVGDVNHDGRDDVAAVRAGQLWIYAGGGLPGELEKISTITALPSDVQVLAAGDVDGDSASDILITGSGGNYLVFGGDLPANATLASLLIDPDGDGPLLKKALELPEGAWRPVGDFDGADGDGNSFTDLGAAVMVTTDRLNESSSLEHQVINVYLGGDRATLEASFATPDLVIEPGRAAYFAPGLAPSSAYFGAALEHVGDDGVTRTLLGASGPFGDSLRLYDGSKIAPANESEAAPGLAQEKRLFVLPLATPVPPGFVPTPPPGVDLANDGSARVRDAFQLEGTSQNEHLAGSQSVADFNGDGFSELLISGDAASYLFLGPVELADIYDVEAQADVIIDAAVGRPASSMGDVNGDGLADLVFLRSTGASGGYAITIISGGLANGVELPRHVTLDWVNALKDDDTQSRVKVRTESGAGFGSDSASIAVLNWNDDGNADIALVRASAPLGDAVQGYVLSGTSLWAGDSERALTLLGSDRLATIYRDSTTAGSVASAMLGGGDTASAFAAHAVQAINARDVTGDGLDDLLLVDAGVAAFPLGSGIPNIGRAYLLAGRSPLSGPIDTYISLASESELMVQDFGLGGSISALGDLNGDGYDDFAIGSNREARRESSSDTDREAGLYVFYGQADFGGASVLGESADIIVTRVSSANEPQDGGYIGALHATAGDLDGDQKMDLVVSEPARALLSDGTLQLLDYDLSGSVSVFFDAVEKASDGSRVLSIATADRTLTGDFEFDGLGTLSTTPAFDLDGDGLDDLVIGAAGADVTTSDVIPGGGRVYVIYGSSSRAALPADAIELGNRSLTGSGFYLVDEGTGRPTVFQDAPGETDPLFVLQNGQDAWYKFTTLGDGMPGNAISVIPGAIDGFLAPIDPDTTTLTADPAQHIGNSLFSQPYVDGAVGSIFVADELTAYGHMTGWSVYGGNFDGAQARFVTPLILKAAAGGGYEITGIGQAEQIEPNTPQDFGFTLVSGSDAVGPGYYLGWYDGSAETGDNAGAIAYSTYGPTVHWFGPDQGATDSVQTGRPLAARSDFVRSYSIQATVTSGAVLEFDLGRFLGWAGDPDAVGSAKLVLDAPTAAAPVAAPINVSAVAFSGGKLFFTASTADKGSELWVTDGTGAGTHLIEDLNPGLVGSYPTNFIDVGGTLYFTANSGVSGTQLYSTDGTSITPVGVIPGYPSNFAAQLGAAELLAAASGPVDGVPAVDYGFAIDILRENGSVDSVQLVLQRSDTGANGDVTDLLPELQAALAAALSGDLSGDLTVSQGLDGRFTFAAAGPDIVRVTVHDGVSGGLGFAADEVSPTDVTLAAPGTPAAFDVASDINFSLELSTVGGSVVTLNFLLSADATDGNASADDLAADLQALINPAVVAHGFSDGGVSVSADSGGHLVLSITDPGIFSAVAHGAEDLGFGADQASTRSVAVTSSADAPGDGRLPADLTFKVAIATSDGQLFEHDVTLLGDDNAGNGSLGELAGQLETALNNAFSADFDGAPLAVSNSGGKLLLRSLDDSILSVSLTDAGPLGFTAEGQASVRSGDRLFFNTYDSTQGAELWKVEGASVTSFDIYAGPANSSPSDLTVIGDTLYFAASDASGRFLWQSVAGATPTKVANQTGFASTTSLIDAGGVLAFVATPNSSNDAQVYSYDGAGTFAKLSNIVPADTTSSPSELAYFNGKVYFAARDHLDGTYSSGSGFTGRELWAATPGAAGSATLARNIAPDSNPVFINIFGTPLLFTPGTVASSYPSFMTEAGGALFFSADDGATGRELWRTNASGTTGEVANLVTGSGGSYPSQITALGERIFFVADGKLWTMDDASSAPTQILLGGASPGLLTVAGDRLYFRANGHLWFTDGTQSGTEEIVEIIPPKVPLQVRVVAGEGDDHATDADKQAATVLTRDLEIGAEAVEVDLTEAVKAALARGDTRLTVLVENRDGEEPVTLNLAGPARDGGTGLQVTPSSPGLVADLLAGDGTVIEVGKSTIDIRAIEAGTYYLRVYDPSGSTTSDVPFQIEVDAPIRGYSHPNTDRDTIHGGDGDDLLVGNQGLDKMWGDSGRDDFIGETLELRDFEAAAGETLTPSLSSERSNIPPEGPPVDAYIAITDPGLRVAIAETLGYAVTQSYIPGQYLIHVPGGSMRTDLPLTDGTNFQERILASALGEMTALDASGRGISDLTGLKYAINLTTLNLADNDIGDGNLDQLVPATQSSGDTRGFPTGMRSLENLLLDFNPVVKLDPLSFLTDLERLSMDGSTTRELLSQTPKLFWPEVGGVERGLDLPQPRLRRAARSDRLLRLPVRPDLHRSGRLGRFLGRDRGTTATFTSTGTMSSRRTVSGQTAYAQHNRAQPGLAHDRARLLRRSG